MKLFRRDFLCLVGAIISASAASGTAMGQTAPGAPKVTQILRKDLEGQGQVVQETVVLIGEFGPIDA